MADEDIDRLRADANWLFGIVNEYHRTAHGSDTQETELWAIGQRIAKAADMLLALKARAEAAEKDAVRYREAVQRIDALGGMGQAFAIARAALEAKP